MAPRCFDCRDGVGIQVEGTRLAATLDLPAGRSAAAVVILHGAQAGHRSYFCLHPHLAQILPDAGIAVLRYGASTRIGGHDVPLADQADDAAAAIAVLRRYVGAVPIGLWGWSQGAWVAPLTAVRNPGLVAFLILVSCSGVSPAAQMPTAPRNSCASTDLPMRTLWTWTICAARSRSTCVGTPAGHRRSRP